MYAYISWDVCAVTLLPTLSLQQTQPFLHESRAHFILMYKAWTQTPKSTDTRQQDIWVDSLQQNDSGIRKETYFSSVWGLKTKGKICWDRLCWIILSKDQPLAVGSISQEMGQELGSSTKEQPSKGVFSSASSSEGQDLWKMWSNRRLVGQDPRLFAIDINQELYFLPPKQITGCTSTKCWLGKGNPLVLEE